MSTTPRPGSSAGIWNSSARTSIRSSVRTDSIDPPRPAKDGHEWVWFPEGYWAERPVAHRDSAKGIEPGPASPVGKLFKWSGRPVRDSADLPLQPEPRETSPRTVVLPSGPPRQFSPARNLPHTPYLSEEAHVQSLQRPMPQSIASRSDQDTWKSGPTVRRISPICVPIAALMSPGERKASQSPQVKHAWRFLPRSREVSIVSFERRKIN